MADGEINRNGATIRIDDDGGVQVEPAEGQEVEYTGPDRGTDAIRDSVSTGELLFNGSPSSSFKLANEITDNLDDQGVSTELSNTPALIEFSDISGTVHSTVNNFDDDSYDYITLNNDGSITNVNDDSKVELTDYGIGGYVGVAQGRGERTAMWSRAGGVASAGSRLLDARIGDFSDITSIELFAPSGSTTFVSGYIKIWEAVE